MRHGNLSRSYNNMIKRDVAPGRGKDPTGCADFPSKAQVLNLVHSYKVIVFINCLVPLAIIYYYLGTPS